MSNSIFKKNVPVMIIGAGGHSKVLIDTIKRSKLDVIGIIDVGLPKGELFCGIPILGDDKSIQNYPPHEVILVNAVGSLPGQKTRNNLALKYRALGYHFMSVIDEHAFVSSDVLLGEGVQIMAGAIIQSGCSIGVDTIINTSSSIDHDCQIGEGCHIAPGVTLSGGVRIEDRTHIGTGASVIQNIKVGFDSVIGAGCVVYKNINDRVILKQSINNIIVKNKDA